MDYSGLTRRHGVRIAGFRCSVEECGLAVGRVVGHGSVVSAARMSGGVVLFVDSVAKANMVVAGGVQVNGKSVAVMPLSAPAVRVTVSNVPPFIRDEALVRELGKHGKIMSQVRKVSSGFKSPLLKHVVSYRRQVLMVLNGHGRDLDHIIKVRVEDFDYVMFTTSGSKCYVCRSSGPYFSYLVY